MNYYAAISKFFNSFGLPAYTESMVPEKAEFPYLAYSPSMPGPGETVSLDLNLWYKTESESAPNAITERIRKAIGNGGVVVQFDDGAAWIQRGSPWCQALVNEPDRTIKRRIMNIMIQYLGVD